jgi:MscS family membrane protein
VYYFTKTVAWSEWHEIKQEINYDILDILKDEGISVLKPIVVLDQQDDEQFQKAGESS